MIIWAGTSNKDVGMVIEHYPKPIIPRRKMEVQSVPGRNGDILLEQDAFENYEQPYSAFLDAKNIGGLERVMPKLSDWLLGHKGYQRLEDSYFPDVYRMAYYSGGAEFINFFNEYGEGTLTFNCAPEKYLKSGDYPISPSSGTVFTNPTLFAAWPEYTLKLTNLSTTGYINYNGTRILTVKMPNNYDSSTNPTIEIIPKEHKILLNSSSVDAGLWLTGKFENLKLSGQTTITFSGFSTFIIKPRWWTI